jgi:hypothetical protein
MGSNPAKDNGFLRAIKIRNTISFHVKWVPFHHGMARPQVMDRGNGLQIWRVAANILNKQSQTADRRLPSSLGVVWGLTSPHHKKLYFLRSIYKGLGNGRILWHNLSTGKWI